MGLVCGVTFETSFHGTFSIHVETGPEGTQVRLAEFGKTRHRATLTPARAAQLQSAIRVVSQLPLSKGPTSSMLDATLVMGVLVFEGHEEAWTVDDLQPDTTPHEYQMAWLLAEAAWEAAGEEAQSILIRIRSEVGRDLPRIAVLERNVGEVLLARVLLPFSLEQRLSIELWVASLPAETSLVVELDDWVGLGERHVATQFPIAWLKSLSLRPRTAFVWPHTTIPSTFEEIVGSHCFPDFYGARRHALFRAE